VAPSDLKNGSWSASAVIPHSTSSVVLSGSPSVDGELPVGVDHPHCRPFRELIADMHSQYKQPVFVAETRHRGRSARAVAADDEP
jgi:hypothetical protein